MRLCSPRWTPLTVTTSGLSPKSDWFAVLVFVDLDDELSGFPDRIEWEPHLSTGFGAEITQRPVKSLLPIRLLLKNLGEKVYDVFSYLPQYRCLKARGALQLSRERKSQS